MKLQFIILDHIFKENFQNVSQITYPNDNFSKLEFRAINEEHENINVSRDSQDINMLTCETRQIKYLTNFTFGELHFTIPLFLFPQYFSQFQISNV